MSNPLAEYLSALEARDDREQAHAEYLRAYTKLADRTAALSIPPPVPAEQKVSPSPTSSKSFRSSTPKGKGVPAADATSSNMIQLRADLAATQKTRAELETKVSTITEELEALKVTDVEQKKRIVQLEKIKEQLERRLRDRAEELKGKGRFVENVQDEMVALNLQLNMTEQENEKLKKENEELTRRWVKKMEEQANSLNERNEGQWLGKKK